MSAHTQLPDSAHCSEWLDERESFGTRRERLLEEIDSMLRPFGGDILDNGPKSSGRYLSDHIREFVYRWTGGAMEHARPAVDEWCKAHKLLSLDATPNARKPLTDQEKLDGWAAANFFEDDETANAFYEGIEFAEKKHGIGGQP